MATSRPADLQKAGPPGLDRFANVSPRRSLCRASRAALRWASFCTGGAKEGGRRRLLYTARSIRDIDVPVVYVKDTLQAFQELAAAHRRRFTIPVVAVSGSNGKTTTKEMIGRVLSERFKTLVT